MVPRRERSMRVGLKRERLILREAFQEDGCQVIPAGHWREHLKPAGRWQEHLKPEGR